MSVTNVYLGSNDWMEGGMYYLSSNVEENWEPGVSLDRNFFNWEKWNYKPWVYLHKVMWSIKDTTGRIINIVK